jgi:hypothetical protein
MTKKKYLSISIIGHNTIRAFDNRDNKKDNDKAPDFKGDGIEVWVNEYEEAKKEEF